jgi:hypothetical protein
MLAGGPMPRFARIVVLFLAACREPGGVDAPPPVADPGSPEMHTADADLGFAYIEWTAEAALPIANDGTANVIVRDGMAASANAVVTQVPNTALGVVNIRFLFVLLCGLCAFAVNSDLLSTRD